MRMRSLLVFALVTATAACEPESSGDVAGDPDTAITPAIVASEPGNLLVTLTEWQLAMSSDTVPAGSYSIQIMNRGNEYHSLEIEGSGVEWVSDTLRSNGETLAQLRLEPGVYEMYCPIVGPHGSHRELGLIDTLVVR